MTQDSNKVKEFKEPSIAFAIIGLFVGYGFWIVGAILLLPFTFFMSAGLIAYGDPLVISILFGVLWLFGYTIPTIIYYYTLDEKKYQNYRMLGMVIVGVLMLVFLFFFGLKYLVPEVCDSLMNSNMTSSSNLGVEYC